MKESQVLRFEDYDIKRFIGILYRGKWIIILTPMIALLGASIYLRYAKPIYQASTTLKIEISNTSEMLNVGNPNALQTDETNRQLEIIEELKSRELLEKVIAKLNLEVSYSQIGRVVNTPIYEVNPFLVKKSIESFSHFDQPFEVKFGDNDSYTVNLVSNPDYVVTGQLGKLCKFQKSFFTIERRENILTPLKDLAFEFTINNLSTLINQIRSSLVITPAGGIFELKYKDAIPHRAKDILNAINTAYLEDELTLRRKSGEQAIRFIDTLMTNVRIQLKGAESNIDQIQKTSKIPDLSGLKDSEMSKLKEYQKQLSDLELKEFTLENLTKYINNTISKSNTENIKFAPDLEGIQNPTLLEYINQLRTVLSEKSALLLKVLPGTPAVMVKDEKIKELVMLIEESINNAKASIREQRKYLEIRIGQVDVKLSSFPRLERDFSEVSSVYINYKDIYSKLLNSKTEMSISQASIVSKSRVINQPYASSEPIAPQRNSIIYGSVLIGLVLGLGYVILKEVLKENISFRGELESKTHIPIIAEIIRTKQKQQRISLQIFSQSRSMVTESFRSLRANIQFATSNKDKRVLITITSTISGEGKSYISTNVSAILSLLGKKVVLVDADLRRPRLHQVFNLNNDAGLSTILIGKDEIRDVVQSTGFANFDIITSGPVPPNPAELLSGKEFVEFMNKLSQDYDYIIIDTSPVGLVTDSIPILKMSDLCLYIFRADYSKKVFLNNIERLKEEHDLQHLYIVMNYVNAMARRYGYGYDYGYGYGYGYGNSYYHDEEDGYWWEFWKKNRKRKS